MKKVISSILMTAVLSFIGTGEFAHAETPHSKQDTSASANENISTIDHWIKENGHWYYLDSKGMMKTGWVYVENKWYFLDSSGAMLESEWLSLDGKWYYLTKSGAMLTDWQRVDGTWYYFNSDGAMQSGWKKISGKWYFLDNSGAMLESEWISLDGKWYYLTKGGAMVTDWQRIGGTWYYFNSNGAMQTGWLKISGKWYFLNNSGAMATGWIRPDGEWYYMFKDGSMATNTAISAQKADTPVASFKTLGNSEQVILVTANGYGTNQARIRTFEKVNGEWIRLFDVAGFLGKDGFAKQMSEYVTQSPRGKFTIGTAFGRYGNPGTELPYRKITSDDVWVDDPASTVYNTWQQASQNNGRWKSAEKMNISAYNYGFVINYNTENPIPGAGSAIFLHVADSYTAGCTGTAQVNVINLLKWLDPGKQPVIIQAPDGEIGGYSGRRKKEVFH